jgi:hypothetical protein
MMAGSRTCRMKARIGTRAISATGTRANSTKTMSAPHSVPTSFMSGSSTASPLCDTVTASAAPTAIGTYRMMMPTSLNIVSARPSQNPRIACLGAPRTWVSAIANRIEKKTICSTLFVVIASKKLVGTTLRM